MNAITQQHYGDKAMQEHTKTRKFYSYQEIEKAIEDSAKYHVDMFLDYVNNFTTLKGFARYYGFDTDHAARIIQAGRKIHNQRTCVK